MVSETKRRWAAVENKNKNVNKLNYKEVEAVYTDKFHIRYRVAKVFIVDSEKTQNRNDFIKQFVVDGD